MYFQVSCVLMYLLEKHINLGMEKDEVEKRLGFSFIQTPIQGHSFLVLLQQFLLPLEGFLLLLLSTQR